MQSQDYTEYLGGKKYRGYLRWKDMVLKWFWSFFKAFSKLFNLYLGALFSREPQKAVRKRQAQPDVWRTCMLEKVMQQGQFRAHRWFKWEAAAAGEPASGGEQLSPLNSENSARWAGGGVVGKGQFLEGIESWVELSQRLFAKLWVPKQSLHISR